MSIELLSAQIGTTLDRFIATRQEEFPYASGELSQLLRDIALASKIINRDINRAGLAGIEGGAGHENIQGEYQQKLDAIANIRFIRALTHGSKAVAIISEEEEHPIITDSPDAKYIIAIDPLDGSSNIDVNVSIGTIFSIYRRKSDSSMPLNDSDFLQKGSDQVAAGYVIYGSSTMLVYTTGHGVNGFTLEPSLGEYFLSHPQIKTPETGNYYSMNDFYYGIAYSFVNTYIDKCRKAGLSSRYIGSLVGDFHRNLLKGGIYLYPNTKESPIGKIRILYECNAFAFLAEQAGGLATNGTTRILDITPSQIHQREPLYVGSKKMIEELLAIAKEGN